MSEEHAGKVAFVTGSGRGLGRLMAERMAAMGASVVLHDLNWTEPAKYDEAADLGEVETAFNARGAKTMTVTGNIGDADAVAKMRDEIEATLGPVDILVNCAGGDIGAAGGKPEPNNALDIPLEDVQALVNNNLIGTIIVCKTFMPAMRDRQSGIVVNIGSVAGQFGVSNGAIYAILKASVAHYTRCLAQELHEHGVRVNCVSPGPAKTARFQATRVVDPDMMNSNKPSFHRYAEPNEIADGVAFLTSHQAKFINGQVLCVDGGLVNFPS
ncbi:MAG: SDR family oxidoreductase [Pseudomonadota bacterium]